MMFDHVFVSGYNSVFGCCYFVMEVMFIAVVVHYEV